MGEGTAISRGEWRKAAPSAASRLLAVPLRMPSALQRYRSPTLLERNPRLPEYVNYSQYTHPTPATREGIDRVLAKPVTPPTIHKPPMVYAG